MNNRNISLYKSHTYHKFSNFIWKKNGRRCIYCFHEKEPEETAFRKYTNESFHGKIS